jgi:hypothetical protein
MNELFKGFCLQTQSYKFSSLLPFKHEDIHFFYLFQNYLLIMSFVKEY